MMADKKELNINWAQQYFSKKANAAPNPSDVTIKGISYTISMMNISTMNDTVNTSMMTSYHVSASQHSDNTGALINHGKNGSITGADCHVIEAMNHFINVEDIDNHVMEKCSMVMAGEITNSNRGPVILIMNQYAPVGKGTSIHSLPQMEWYNVQVDDKSIKIGGAQGNDSIHLMVALFC